jgi:signal peptidase II
MEQKTPKKQQFSFRQILFFLPVTIILIIIDQITKKIAVDVLSSGRSIPLIDGILEFTYVQNRGAAFGILQNALPFFVVITLAALLVICYILTNIPADRHYLPLRLCLCFIAAGAIGNFIDRMMISYVRDFIYFSLINFPVFNVADIYITCATIFLMLLIIFYYREDEDLGFLK